LADVKVLYVTPDDRDTRPLHPADALAIWPPVAGGKR
jgi:hypothetical protein